MRLASGIAPIRRCIDEGVNVGLGVDGSSSNDSGNLLNEARQAMLLQRVNLGANKFSPREALYTATRGGANVLNRNDIGQISEGKAADFAIYDLNSIALSGTWSDPLAALVLCSPMQTAYTICNGKIISEKGNLNNIDIGLFLEKDNKISDQSTMSYGLRLDRVETDATRAGDDPFFSIDTTINQSWFWIGKKLCEAMGCFSIILI